MEVLREQPVFLKVTGNCKVTPFPAERGPCLATKGSPPSRITQMAFLGSKETSGYYHPECPRLHSLTLKEA
jgi:hypothetical protein